MNRPPRRIVVAVLLVAGLALLALGVAIGRAMHPMSLTSWAVAGELTVALALAKMLPVPITTRVLHTVASTAFLLTAVLVPLPVAMIGAAMVWIVGDRFRRVTWSANGRVPWYDTTFNTGERMLRIAAGAVVFNAVAGTSVLASTVGTRLLVAVLLTGLTMYAANNVLVHAIVSVQAGRWQLGALKRLLQANLLQEGSLLLLGVLGALIAGPAPLLVALPLATTIVVYREMARQAGGPLVELVQDADRADEVAAMPVLASTAAQWFGAG